MRKKFDAKRSLLRWVVIVSFLFILGLGFWFFRPHSEKPSEFGKVLQLYTFKPEVSATAYNSKVGNATIIWLSDLQDSTSAFGEIWQVYTFKPGVIATSYQSERGDATIIWISGMDDEGDSHQGTSS